MTNLERLQSMQLAELADYIEAVYLSGILTERAKNNPDIKMLFDMSTENYCQWLEKEYKE